MTARHLGRSYSVAVLISAFESDVSTSYVLQNSRSTSSPNRRNTSRSIRHARGWKTERDARKKCKANMYNDKDDMDSKR